MFSKSLSKSSAIAIFIKDWRENSYKFLNKNQLCKLSCLNQLDKIKLSIKNGLSNIFGWSIFIMIFLICQDWANTSNNHAGIKYLCNTIQRGKPSLFKSYTLPYFLDETQMSSNRVIRKFQVLLAKYRHKNYVHSFTKKFLRVVDTKDSCSWCT